MIRVDQRARHRGRRRRRARLRRYTYDRPVRYHLDCCTLREHAAELHANRLVLVHMGPSMLAVSATSIIKPPPTDS